MATEQRETLDPGTSAEEAGLRYVSDAQPGVRRRRAGRGFTYIGPDGSRITDPERLAWFKRLAIPPAWTDVWISPIRNGHIQATGRDARGRKQYRYHPRWREVRDAAKYGRMIEFARALPRIRRATDRDLRKRGTPREKVLALVVRLLEATLIRVGNEEYARENRSFGLSTLRQRHVDVRGSRLTFSFRGKGGKEHAVEVIDRRLARMVRQVQELPGQLVFQYVDEDGRRQPIDSADVNDYLREIAGDDFTAKDFRTWAGTVAASMALREFTEIDSEVRRKKAVVEAIERVARQLGNTPAVCRACYIHPDVVEEYLNGTLVEALSERARGAGRGAHALRPEEAAVLGLLQARLARERRRRAPRAA
ncbi:MAG TPA: DNA topoisomerase IB [Candidatus Limnocylindria bacterium]|nr:DNA topoisomerase IB [Candidatus Limnocylindria bacterium]